MSAPPRRCRGRRVELNVAGQRPVASITVEAVEQLGLEPGKEIVAVIKASDVMVGVDEAG